MVDTDRCVRKIQGKNGDNLEALYYYSQFEANVILFYTLKDIARTYVQRGDSNDS